MIEYLGLYIIYREYSISLSNCSMDKYTSLVAGVLSVSFTAPVINQYEWGILPIHIGPVLYN